MKQLTVTRSEGTNMLFVKHTFDQELYNKLKSLPRIQWNNEKNRGNFQTNRKVFIYFFLNLEALLGLI